MRKITSKAYLAQTIAVVVKNLVRLSLGLCLSYPQVLISALTGLNSKNNPNETIRITEEDASWLGSIGFAAQVVGSILSGFLSEAYGRKKALWLINIPNLLAWAFFYWATSFAEIFIGACLLGLVIGLINSPCAVYVGEVSESSIRDILTALTGFFVSVGILCLTLSGNLASWRIVALYCSIVPIITVFAYLFIPETPAWLLSKNRDEDAMRSLRWLRGWTSEEDVHEEFKKLQSFRDQTNSCSRCQTAKITCTHPRPTLIDMLRSILEANCMKPIIIFSACSLFTNFSGLHHINPFIVQILNTFHSPIDPNQAIVLFAVASLILTSIFIGVIKFVGKRHMYFASLLGMAACNFALGTYAILYLPHGARSFDYTNASNAGADGTSYFPMIILVISNGFTTGLIEVPFMFTSELFPLKARCFAAGICSAIFNLVLFVTSKTFYNMENWFGLSYTLCIYGVSALLGIITLYRFIPHTENASLADIERHFTNKQHKWTDWKIAKENDTTK